MKVSVTYGYTFNAAAKTIDFSAIPNFDIKRLLAVINITRNQTIYAVGSSTLGFAGLAGTVLTLVFDTTAYNNADLLEIIYDDPDVLPQTPSGALRVGNAADRFREEWYSYDTTNTWIVDAQGAGQTASVAGSLNGARYLAITSGTTANEEFILRSRQAFKLSCRAAAGITASAKAANLTFTFELVEVTAEFNGTVVTDTAIASSPSLKDARNGAAWVWDGNVSTTVTQGQYVVRSGGVSEILSANQTFQTLTATGSTPNFLPATMFEIGMQTESVRWDCQPVDSTTGSVVTNMRTQAVPEMDKWYAIRFRLKNGAVAPANTTYRIHAVRMLAGARMTVDLNYNQLGPANPKNMLPVIATQSGTWAVNQDYVQNTTNGPSTTSTVVSAASTNATLVKAGATRLAQVDGHNTSAAVKYVKFFNKATAPVTGTDTPVYQIAVAPGMPFDFSPPAGMRFALGLGIAITGGSALLDNTAVAAGDVILSTLYT